jgi:glycosyltransferase involved in cell wall biosynthesis
MILLISSVFPPEPVVSASIGNDLAIALSEHHKVIVITPKPTRPMGFFYEKELKSSNNFEHIVLNSFTCPKSSIIGRMRESYSFGKHILKYVKNKRNEIKCIYLHSWPLLAPYIIIKAAKKYSIPSVIHIVDIYPEALTGKLPIIGNIVSRFLLPIDKFALRNATKVITISPKMKDYLILSRNLPEENKVEMIYNWQNEISFIRFHETYKNERKKPLFTFMFLGNLNNTAAIDNLICSFAEAKLKNSRLVIAGNGSEKANLVALANQYGDVVIEFWNAPISEVPEIQSKADILLLGLRKGISQFALPSKLPAYLFSAKPIIACVEKGSDTAEIINTANSGWVVPPENIKALVQVMKDAVITSSDNLLKYGINGYNYALKNFSKETNLTKFVKIINEISLT